jgi:hypothetical protein
MRGAPLEITAINLNVMVSKFYNMVIFDQLLNSGKSNLSKQQDEIIKKTYDLAYEILRYANNNDKYDLFARIYNTAINKIIINDDVKAVMQYPEKYVNMVVAKKEFEIKTARMLQRIIAKQKSACIIQKTM